MDKASSGCGCAQLREGLAAGRRAQRGREAEGLHDRQVRLQVEDGRSRALSLYTHALATSGPMDGMILNKQRLPFAISADINHGVECQTYGDLPRGRTITEAKAAHLFEHHAALLVEHAVDATQGALGALHLHLCEAKAGTA